MTDAKARLSLMRSPPPRPAQRAGRAGKQLLGGAPEDAAGALELEAPDRADAHPVGACAEIRGAGGGSESLAIIPSGRRTPLIAWFEFGGHAEECPATRVEVAGSGAVLRVAEGLAEAQQRGPTAVG